MNILKNTDSTGERLYDINMVKKMCHGNQELIVKMAEVFIEQLLHSVKAIQFAYTQNDLVSIKNEIHKIKPALTYYGTVEIATELQFIGTLIDASFTTIDLEKKIVRLEYLTTQVVAQLKSEFNIINT